MSGKDVDIEHWSRIAAEWTAWARAPNHDAFWAYRASLVAFIGQGVGDALDVGCGEGRVSRVLKDCGYRVTAVDPVEQLISAAEQAGSADAYKIAAAADLPFKNCSFDLAVAYNVLMDVMGYKCISPAGHSPWKAIWPRWKARSWRSRRYGSPFRTRVIKAAIWSAGIRFPSSSG